MFTIEHCKNNKIALNHYPINSKRWIYYGTCPQCKAFILYKFKIDSHKTHYKKYVGEEAKALFENCIKSTGVYFLKQGNFVKIGYSENLTQRLKNLQSASPEKQELLFTISGTMETEKRLQGRFKQYNTTGEWFSIDGKLKDFINYCMGFKDSANSIIIKY